MISVMIAFSNVIFSRGVESILNQHKDIKIIEILKTSSIYTDEQLAAVKPDIVLVDFLTLYNAFPDIKSTAKEKYILLDTNCGKTNIVAAVMKKNLSGVLLSNSTPDHLIEAINAVAKNEIWLDEKIENDIISGIKAIKSNSASRLDEKEKEVLNLISLGFTEKETAKKLRISEPTTRSHLNHLFRKLEIKNNTQLVAYAIKIREVNPISN